MLTLCAARQKRSVRLAAVIAIVVAGLSSPAMAHITGVSVAGFSGGFAHPFTGLDHILAMVAVGLWASQLGRPAYWVLPLAFAAVMAAGAGLGIEGVPLLWVEIGIAGSVVILGSIVALALKPSLAVSIAPIGLFALLHGHSHGAELPQATSPVAYAAGFLIATLTLHAVGLTVGSTSRWQLPRIGVRAAGATIAAIGVVLLISA